MLTDGRYSGARSGGASGETPGDGLPKRVYPDQTGYVHGLYSIYVDALLYFGNVRTAFRSLRDLSSTEIHAFFSSKRFDTDAIKRRGAPLPLRPIARDSRYLISEMACKSYGDSGIEGDLRKALV
jgi:hypothetical protein